MWFLAQPLVEGWMRDTLGPEARITEAAEDFADSLRRLPKMVADVEKSAASVAQGGLKLHPDTVRQMHIPEARRQLIPTKAYWFVIAALAILLFLV